MYYVISQILINEKFSSLKGIRGIKKHLQKIFLVIIRQILRTYTKIFWIFILSSISFSTLINLRNSSLNVVKFGSAAHELFLRPSRSHRGDACAFWIHVRRTGCDVNVFCNKMNRTSKSLHCDWRRTCEAPKKLFLVSFKWERINAVKIININEISLFILTRKEIPFFKRDKSAWIRHLVGHLCSV